MSEYICNAWFQVENHKLTYMKTHQKEIKAESYQNLHDALSAREDVTQVGDRVIRGVRKKSGLASELITLVLEQLEPNGQVLRIADNICNIFVYIRFLYVEN